MIFEVGQKVKLINKDEILMQMPYAKSEIEAVSDKQGTVVEREADEWTGCNIYYVNFGPASDEKIWVTESFLADDERETPHGALSETSKKLLHYCDAFFSACQVVGKISGKTSYVAIKAWVGLYEVAFSEREDGILVVAIRDRVQNGYISSKQFNYIREPESLFLDVNQYLEENGVI